MRRTTTTAPHPGAEDTARSLDAEADAAQARLEALFASLPPGVSALCNACGLFISAGAGHACEPLHASTVAGIPAARESAK